ncbi:intermembrane phospholipid transport protein YdbH family protein [Kiloniella sp.]|uniref:intermembrane phospholipid transport protein YdbH family protein n=1 Tax=Kiloniella sp. TaxID=1938587 RepID=UPI003B01B015
MPDIQLEFTDISNALVTPFTPHGLPQNKSDVPVDMALSGTVRSVDESLGLPQVQFSAEGAGNLRKVDLSGKVGLLKGATILAVEGSFVPETLDGEFDVVIPTILFTDGGVQPTTFSPALSEVKVENGTFSGHAEIKLEKGKPDGHGYINVDITDAIISDLPISGLAGRFFFQGVTAPTLPPGQSLKVKALDAGVPITDIELLFGAFLEQEQPVIDLRGAGLMITGGQISLRPDVFQILAKKQNIEIQVDKLDVKELFALIGRDDLSGTGRLSGQIPITIEDDHVVIKAGHLATEGPGVLQIRSQAIANALASGGEQVELLIKALQNFDYTELSLDIDKPLNGAAQVRLGISGANKDVLDGHPFRLNINLETRIEPLLDVLLKGQQISQGLISGFMKNR